MKSEGIFRATDFATRMEMQKLEEVATINEMTINPKTFDWLHYTDISSVGTRTVETPLMISGGDAPSRARRVLRAGDTVLSTVRPNRKSYFQFKGDWERAIASTGFAVISPKNSRDADYLYAVLTTDVATRLYESLCEGGAYPAFNPRALAEIEIPWPSESAREFVGGLSAALLEKVDVNSRISTNLEEIAQSIFKSWFVDFNPVRAKMAGEKPVGLDDATASLFPDSMEESELGPIPKGWKVRPFKEIASICKTSINPQKHPEATFRHYSIPDFDKNRYPRMTFGEEILSNKFQLNSPAVLVSKLNPETKRIWTVANPEKWSICSTEFIVLNPKSQVLLGFLHSIVRAQFFYDQFASLATGSTGSRQRVRPEEILNIKCSLPDSDMISKFSAIVQPLLERLDALSEEIQTLQKLHDALLPRLISGELQIPEEMLVS
jgi:type I restriction enzyme S subunit